MQRILSELQDGVLVVDQKVFQKSLKQASESLIENVVFSNFAFDMITGLKLSAYGSEKSLDGILTERW